MNVQDLSRPSASLVPTAEGSIEMLRLMLASGANVRRRQLRRHRADSTADRGYVEIVRALLETDSLFDHVNRLGWTALLEAIFLSDRGPRHTEVIRLQLDAGADPNLADRRGVSPLAHARLRGHTAIVQLLTAASATSSGLLLKWH